MKSTHQNVLLDLPTDAAARKNIPITTGCLDYFPMAIAEIAAVSKKGNDQHNPGEPLHWARQKSTDQADTIIRHLMQRGTRDSDGTRHSAKMAWRALALLQEEIEAEAGFKPEESLQPAEAFLQRQPEPEPVMTQEEIEASPVFKQLIKEAGALMQEEYDLLRESLDFFKRNYPDKFAEYEAAHKCTCTHPSVMTVDKKCPVHGILSMGVATHWP